MNKNKTNDFDEGIDEPSFSSNKSTDEPKFNSELVTESIHQYSVATSQKMKKIVNFITWNLIFGVSFSLNLMLVIFLKNNLCWSLFFRIIFKSTYWFLIAIFST